MSLRELARQTGRNRGYLSRLERGHITAVADKTVQDIARALQVPPDAITRKEKP